MKSAGNKGVVQRRLQVLHVHIFLLPHCVPATWRSSLAQTSIRAEFPSGNVSYHAGSAADFTVQPLDHVVGADAGSMLAGKIAVDQSFLNAVLDLLGSLL